MKALFAFSGKIFLHNNKHYSLSLTAEAWENLYLDYCDTLIVCEREQNVNNISGLKLAEHKKVNFECTSIGIHSIDMYLKRSTLEKHIEKLVKQSDYVIARMALFGVIAVKYAKKYNKPYICEVVGSSWDASWNHSLVGKMQAPYLELLVKYVIKKAPYVVYVTQEFLQKEYPCIGKSIGISDVELLSFDDNVLKRRLNKISNMTSTYIYKLVTVAGVNVRAKGHKYVIKALSKLKQKSLMFEYYLVGEGNQSYLRALAKRYGVFDQIKFVGPLSHDKVFEFLEDMDIYIQVSLQEGLPRAVVEAMSCGLPVIGSKTAGIPELIEDDMLCRRRNVKDICSILENYNKDMLIKKAERNYLFSKKFDRKVLLDRRKKFFEMFLFDNNLQKKI